MAHLRPLNLKCFDVNCNSRATVELFNRHNSSLGQFCRNCGKARLLAIDKIEKEYDGRKSK